jgi:threonine synthase
VGSKEAILQGLCPDGGLYVSDDMLGTKLDIRAMMLMDYEEIVFTVFRALLTDYSDEELKDCISKAYRGKFSSETLTPVTPIGDKYLLELYHGPTSAFKDMALCMLPQLMSKALKDEQVMILTATSGDTGKAALAGFRDAENIGITVFYPHGGVSDIQYLQMATAEGANVNVAAVRGNFDDCQTGVKQIFAKCSGEIRREYGISLSSANSINVGRLVPQIVYYIEAYKQLYWRGAIRFGEEVDFVVPTGNFGDILAGWYAKTLGLPAGRLIIASNDNNVLTDFLNSGVYDKRRSFYKTISPSMDILVSSNLERLLYEAADRDGALVKTWMDQLKECGSYSIGEQRRDWMLDMFWGDCADNKDTLTEIRKRFQEDHYLMDPHTAVGGHVLRQYRLATNDATPTVLLSTASPYKFAADVLRGIAGMDAAEGKDAFACSEELEKLTGVPMPAQVKALKELPVRHRAVCKRDAMGEAVLKEFE